ncbi:MAG: M20/M25/M40 family metallo-hydrolase [Bacteroidales bacterium]|nr:M20/M25/M40 family metallo-hydrolase [Bacteroidales bacterium]
MKSIKSLSIILLFVLIPFLAGAQHESVDLEMVYKIKQYEKSKSQIEELSFWMTDYLGPRLTASAAKLRANEWVKEKFEEYGLENAVIDEVRSFSRGGWDNKKTYVAMTAPYYSSFAANPKAWSGSTKGLVKGEVVLVDIKSEEDLENFKGKLKGKIAIMPSSATYEPSFEPLATRYTDEELDALTQESLGGRGRYGNFDYAAYMKAQKLRRAAADFMKSEGVAVIIHGSGQFNVPRSTGVSYKSGEKEPIAEVNLPIEAHGRIVRLIKHDVPVHMEVDIKNKFIKSEQVTNLMAEIPGTDPDLKDEIVLIGGHFDSWHGGTGAADNASGCIVMMEVMRILKELDVQPRRTIRIALWGGEEQGLNGSRGYVEKYIRDSKTMELKPGFDNFNVYFNMDNGTGKYRGIYLQGNEMIRPVFETWLAPFASMGASTVSIRNTSGTDHQSFDPLGLPAFQFIQDDIEYGRGYHTVMDTYERLIMSDLKHNAIITAALVYEAAMRDEKLPRKPYVKPDPNARRMRF